MHDTTTIAEWRKMGRRRLKPLSLQADLEIDVLLGSVLGLSRAQLFTRDEHFLTPDQLATLDDHLDRLENDEPLAYVLGETEFWSLPIRVTSDVLIPRPDTELLVETALDYLADLSSASVLELGTGSGAIALALAHSRPNDTIIATDISAKALEVARSNRERLDRDDHQLNNLSFVLSDWYANVAPDAFDLIVSNPPYIETSDPHVTASVRRYEPESAVFSGKQGLEDIELIVAGAARFLKPDGRVLLEHGWRQHQSVSRYFTDQGYVNIASRRDLAGHYRVTGATKKENEFMHAEFQQLFDIWSNHIPLVNAMKLELHEDASQWYLSAPLEPNANHMGTGFGGSLAAIATLAGWAQTYLLLPAPQEADIVVGNSQVKYLKPAVTTLIGTADLPTDAEIEKFLHRYEKSGRAGIIITTRIHSNDIETVTLRAKFIATRKETP